MSRLTFSRLKQKYQETLIQGKIDIQRNWSKDLQ